jgi:hypothetical protein
MFVLAEVPFLGLIVAPAHKEALVDRCDKCWPAAAGTSPW